MGHVQARVRDTAAADGLRARLDLTLLDAEGCDRLRAIRPMIEAEAKLALSAFFERLQNTPEIASLFTSARQIDRLQELEVAHWSILSDGRFDGLYVDRSVILGEVRQRIGLDAGWSIGGHALVLERVIRRLVDESGAGFFGNFTGRAGRALLADRLVDVVKAALIDIDMQVSHRLREQSRSLTRELEDELATRGYTLGHSPQSLYRSSGYEQIEQRLADLGAISRSGRATPLNLALVGRDRGAKARRRRGGWPSIGHPHPPSCG